MIAPWLQQYWQQCTQALRQGKLPHAILLSGSTGLGKFEFARHLAERLLCTGEGDLACGHCQSCHWFAAGSHPDYKLISPEEDKKQISVAQIRDLTEALTKTSYGYYQVVIIHPSEAMNRAASNALLKTLEEPNGQVILILVCDHPAGLLPTIRSRCQEYRLQQPSTEVALAWLTTELASLPKTAELKSKSSKSRASPPDEKSSKSHATTLDLKNAPSAAELLSMADGLPLRALRLAITGDWQQHNAICSEFIQLQTGQMSVLKAAEIWSKQSPQQVLTILTTLVQDLIRLMAGLNTKHLQYPHRAAEFLQILQHSQREQLWTFRQQILIVKRRAMTSANPNVQLLFESLLLSYGRTNG